MIKHTVLFQFKACESIEVKKEMLREAKQALESLMGRIQEIKSLYVGLNINPKEVYDMSLITTFNSMEDLEAYVIHPEHQKVVRLLKPNIIARASVDSEC